MTSSNLISRILSNPVKTHKRKELSMSIKETFQFLSTDKQNSIHAIKWIPEDNNVRAVFQISHGMMEYIERYNDFAEFLTKSGFLVVGHDHLGHGHSVAFAEDLGHICEKDGSTLLVDDMHQLRKLIQLQYPDKPYFMLGHSMGSYLLRKYLTIYGEHLAGAFIMGTGTVEDNATKIAIATCKFLAKFHGWNYRSGLVEKMTRGKPFKKFSADGSIAENSWLTKDSDIVKKYYCDPYCTFYFSLGAYLCLFETVLYDNQLENAKKIPKDLPVFLLSGKDDPVGDFGKGVEKVYRQLQNAGITDITFRLYENDRHEILNELDRNQIYGDILTWCENHMS
ncbi:MAG: alpha/beta fold hydrolase [Lachnospiraceae bacterium]